MSLDVYLCGDPEEVECTCSNCDNIHKTMQSNGFYSANISHNLGKMAGEAGIYEVLWCPEEISITKASQLIEPLKKGVKLLKSDPARFEAFNSENGWGMYKHFVPFVEDYLRACEERPEANVSVSR